MTSFFVFSLLFRASRGGGHCIYFPKGTRVPFLRCKYRKKNRCVHRWGIESTYQMIPWILHRCTPESCSEKDIPSMILAFGSQGVSDGLAYGNSIRSDHHDHLQDVALDRLVNLHRGRGCPQFGRRQGLVPSSLFEAPGKAPDRDPDPLDIQFFEIIIKYAFPRAMKSSLERERAFV